MVFVHQVLWPHRRGNSLKNQINKSMSVAGQQGEEMPKKKNEYYSEMTWANTHLKGRGKCQSGPRHTQRSVFCLPWEFTKRNCVRKWDLQDAQACLTWIFTCITRGRLLISLPFLHEGLTSGNWLGGYPRVYCPLSHVGTTTKSIAIVTLGSVCRKCIGTRPTPEWVLSICSRPGHFQVDKWEASVNINGLSFVC